MIEQRVTGVHANLERLLSALLAGFCLIEQVALVAGHAATAAVSQVEEGLAALADELPRTCFMTQYAFIENIGSIQSFEVNLDLKV